MERKPSIEKTGPAAPELEVDDVLKTSDIPATADLAARFLLNAEGYGNLTPEAEKKLLQKIDWVMIPMASPPS